MKDRCIIKIFGYSRLVLWLFLLNSALIILWGCYKAPVEKPYYVSEIHDLISRAEKAYERRDFERSISLYKEALQKSRLIQDDRTSGIILINLSRILSSQNRVEEAKRSIETARELLKRNREIKIFWGDIREAGVDGITLEGLFEELDFEEARVKFIGNEELEGIANSLRHLIDSKNNSIKIRSLNLLARVYLRQGKLEEAEPLILESLKLNSGFSRTEEANSYRILGEIYLNKISGVAGENECSPLCRDQTGSAESYLLRALSIDRELGLPEKIGLDMELLARLYKKTGQVERAKDYFIRSLEIWRGLGDDERIKELLKELSGSPKNS